MFKLVIEDDEGRASEVRLLREHITIGRDAENMVRLEERNVSRHHARVVRDESIYFLEDAGSRYGIRLNGAQLAGRTQLQLGDHIQIGDYQIAVQKDGEPSMPVAPRAVPQLDNYSDQETTGALNTIPLMDSQEPPPPSKPSKPTETPVEADATLMVISSNVPRTTFPLEGREWVIGREEECAISIDHVSMSRHHARITYNGRLYSIVDLDSANGIRINDEEVGARDLRSGDVIQLGQIKLRFVNRSEQGALEERAAQYRVQQEGQRWRHTILWLCGALLLLSVVLVWVLAAPNDETQPVPAVATSPDPIGVAKTHLAARRWSEAREVLRRLLLDHPDHMLAVQLRQQARNGELHEQLYRDLKAATQGQDAASIERQLKSVPVDSVYRKEAEALAQRSLEALRRRKMAIAAAQRTEDTEKAPGAPTKTALPSGTGTPETNEAKEGVRAKGSASARASAKEASSKPTRNKSQNRARAKKLYQQARSQLESNPSAAVSLLKQAIRLDAKLAGPYKILGNYYAEQGKPKKACKYLKRFLRVAPKHRQAASIRTQLKHFGCGS